MISCQLLILIALKVLEFWQEAIIVNWKLGTRSNRLVLCFSRKTVMWGYFQSFSGIGLIQLGPIVFGLKLNKKGIWVNPVVFWDLIYNGCIIVMKDLHFLVLCQFMEGGFHRFFAPGSLTCGSRQSICFFFLSPGSHTVPFGNFHSLLLLYQASARLIIIRSSGILFFHTIA